jgi:hypothetical protein
MSGPKVVNIQALRRQQKREASARLRSVESLLAECLRLCGEDEERKAQLAETTSLAIKETTALGETDQWDLVLRNLESQEAFLASEQAALRDIAASRHAETLRRADRIAKALSQTQAAILALPDGNARNSLLESLKPETLTETIHSLSERSIDATVSAETERLKNFITEFQAPSAIETLSSTDPDQTRLERCWKIIGECQTYPSCAAEQIESWKSAAASASQAPRNERSLRLDSLVLELSSYLQQERERSSLLSEIKSLREDFRSLEGGTSAVWLAQLSLEITDLNALRSLNAEARAALDAEHAKNDLSAQRAAVLRALTACGYEVGQNMESAWVEDGHIVVRKPGESRYGVEFTAPSTGTAVQTRVVALAVSGRDPQRDKEIEETWCSDFQKLRNLLSSGGFTTDLKHATAPGASPLKTIASSSAERSRADPASNPKKKFFN